MILSESDLRQELKRGTLSIDPLSDETIRENGVDLRIASELTRLLKQSVAQFDIQSPTVDRFYMNEHCESSFVINPSEKILVSTLEKVTLPDNIMAFCQLRSTFARAGLSIPPTVADAGFSGNLTIQLSGSCFPVKIPVKMRFLHLIFADLKSPTSKPYSGKYQNDRGVSTPKVDR